jgi:hypothetical protein
MHSLWHFNVSSPCAILKTFALTEIAEYWLKWWASDDGSHMGIYIGIFILLALSCCLCNAGIIAYGSHSLRKDLILTRYSEP